MKRRKSVKRKVSKLSAKSHVLKCKECKTPTVAAYEASWVICPICVAKSSVLIVKKPVRNPRKKKGRK